MSAQKYKESVDIDFLFFGDIVDYAKSVEDALRESFKKATNLAGELQGRLFISSCRGQQLTLTGHLLYHGNVTIELEYTSERTLTDLVHQHVFPQLLREYVLPHLNSERCVELKNMYSTGYIMRMVRGL